MFAYTFLISYCNQDSNVETIFIHTTLDAGDILKCINALRGIQRRKYIGQEVDEDMKNQIDATLLAQPLFVGVVDLILFPAEDELSDPVMEPVKFLLVLDMESMCLFNNSSYLYPEHRLMFWTISDELSVEKVKLLTDTNRAKLIRLFRKDLCFQFPSITRLVEKLQKMTPTRQHLLKNPQELVGFLSERKRVSAQRPPTQTSQPWDDHDAQTSQPWVGHDADETQGPFSSDRKLALKLRNELDSAVEELKSNEEIEVFWVTMAADAQEMMDAGTIPTCDHRSGGMDPRQW
ncbi:hypothetical protein DPMN_056120 [Dreissena polymorpha]|uniref:Uncharacterized protein n=1 Tax=Dreissena polymorpha TaxID=45954 RepID=A0A9D4CSU8_DREPO|nr:hypothetical protein DPMN_056120 [Dreissena polymorpha]